MPCLVRLLRDNIFWEKMFSLGRGVLRPQAVCVFVLGFCCGRDPGDCFSWGELPVFFVWICLCFVNWQVPLPACLVNWQVLPPASIGPRPATWLLPIGCCGGGLLYHSRIWVQSGRDIAEQCCVSPRSVNLCVEAVFCGNL